MSDFYSKVLNEVYELSLLKAFGSEKGPLTLQQIERLNISPIRSNIILAIRIAVRRGSVSCEGSLDTLGGLNYDRCKIAIQSDVEKTSRISVLEENIRSAASPDSSSRHPVLRCVYRDMLSAELSHIACQAGLIERRMVKPLNYPVADFAFDQSYTLKDISNFVLIAARLMPSKYDYLESYDVLKFAYDLMALKGLHGNYEPEIIEINQSSYIQNQIFFNDFLHKGDWGLESPMCFPMGIIDSYRSKCAA